uniref:Uncharacterized protein n=1 Tax=Plectus sambesii TaxID=2011161 RepID=A0A914UZJ7_9BILA
MSPSEERRKMSWGSRKRMARWDAFVSYPLPVSHYRSVFSFADAICPLQPLKGLRPTVLSSPTRAKATRSNENERGKIQSAYVRPTQTISATRPFDLFATLARRAQTNLTKKKKEKERERGQGGWHVDSGQLAPPHSPKFSPRRV